MAVARLPGGWHVEFERAASGEVVSVLTVFLANRRCPWKCVFCDLWKHALEDGVAPGDIPAQLDVALSSGAVAGAGPIQAKLYNAGSFFDPRAIPVVDHPLIAAKVARFQRVIVECHPALIGDRVWRFQESLAEAARIQGSERAPELEVAMGLETVNPGVLPRLGKRVTLDGFSRASELLARHGVALRSFVLVQPPFEAPGEAVEWARRSTEFAIGCGATAVTLIPVRPGTPELEALAEAGIFSPPTLLTLEQAFDASLGVAAGRCRVFADLWNLGQFASCPECLAPRRARLERMNHGQHTEPRVVGACAGGHGGDEPAGA